MTEHAAVVGFLADWPNATPTQHLSDPCSERVRQAVAALTDSPTDVGEGDLAGLIGHWLTRESLAGRGNRVRVPRGVSWPTEERWKTAGLTVVTRDASGFVLAPGDPWKPNWEPGRLCRPEDPPPLDAAFREARQRADDLTDRPAADPCLRDVLGDGFARFTCPGQQVAVRAAFLLPPGQTLLVVLPTGAGKSLVGLAPAVLGWPARGTTLVVVPTVALAFDQAHQARALLARAGAHTALPLAWHSGLAEEDRVAIKRAVRDGTQPILFASPEAILQSLSPALFDAAAAGLLRAMVIDEAHLVAQWGNDFRPEFQSLAGLREQLLAECPEGRRFRTTLLTATLTQESFATLRALFGTPQVVSAVHLRPEPSYWVSHAPSWPEQRTRVLEACRRVPRPFLLYVTQQKHAEAWEGILRADGMRRVRHVHGGSGDRAGVLRLWRDNQIDAVVATSAFGLGMDKGDVRAVIHACVPETVDRYYQEVGRGGRDGRACVSVAIYTDQNLKEADGLNRERVITTDLGRQRWAAMFATRPKGGEREDVFAVDLRAKRPGQTQDNDANVGWNLQTLNLMARAGLIRLHAARPPEVERLPGESADVYEARVAAAFERYFTTARVQPLNGLDLRSPEVWEDRVQPERERTAGAAGDQLDLLKRMLSGGCEFSDALSQVYQVEGDGVWIGADPVCAGCPVCRTDGQDRTAYTLPRPVVPDAAACEPDPRLRSAAGVSVDAPLAVVTYPPPGPSGRERRRWDDLLLGVLLPRLIALGVREVSASPGWAERPAFRALYRLSPDRYVLYSSRDEVTADEWPVPRVTLLDPADPPPVVPARLFGLSRPFHLLLVPEDARDPDRAGDPYRARNPTTPLDALLTRLDR
jgi:superfamily II DNA/RNA helicase